MRGIVRRALRRGGRLLEVGSASAQERHQEEERQGTNLPPRLIDVLISQQERRQEETPRRREQAAQRSPLPERASLAEEREKFVAEVGHEPSPDAVDDGVTDLHHAAVMNLPALTAYLLNNGADVHAKNKYGSTPLHLAAWEDTSATAEVLLNRGADVHANNNYGKTPLDVAVSRNAHKTAEVLRRYGARNNKSGGKGNRESGQAQHAKLGRLSDGANKSRGEENRGCITKSLVGMGILVLIGLLSC